MTITLKRTYKDNCTIGDFTIPVYIKEASGNTMSTLELPNKNNQKDISCIPEGNYIVKLYKPNNKSLGDMCLKLYEVDTRIPFLKDFWTDKDLVSRRQIMLNSCIFKENLREVTGRSNILIHLGNSVSNFEDFAGQKWKQNSHGCILLGLQKIKLKDKENKERHLVLKSKIAMQILIDYINEAGGIEELIIK